MFLFNPIKQLIDNKIDIKLKIFYFSLEMSKQEKMLSAFCNILFVNENIRISPKELISTRKEKILDESIIKKIESYQPYFDKIEEIVEFIDDVRNPTGIGKIMYNYAKENGKIITRKVKYKNAENEIEVFDKYIPNNPEEYVMCIVDHISLISTESDGTKKLNLHESIVKLSSEYFVKLRNNFNYIPVVIQQQASAQESVENLKANRLKPTLDGLGDCKLTQRDCNVALGLFSPFRHNIKEYFGYDITKFKDNIRFLEVLASRSGGGNTVCPLYFDGAVNYFKELCKPNNSLVIEKYYQLIKKNESIK